MKLDALGTTFGGGPMACAVIEAVIEAIESEDLLANVRRVAEYIRKTCMVGPVTGHQGAGFLTGLKTRVPAKLVQQALLGEDILDRHQRRSERAAPAAAIRAERESDVDLLARSARAHQALKVQILKRFLDLADLERDAVLDLLELAARLESAPEPQALAGRILGLVFFNPSLRTLASFQAGMARLGGSSLRDHARARAPGSWRRASAR